MKNVNPKKHANTINQIAQYVYDNIEENISLDSLSQTFLCQNIILIGCSLRK